MEQYGPFVVAALWGLGSAQLFVQGWIAAADLVIAVIALLRGRMSRALAIQAIVAALATGVIYSVLLRIGFWVVAVFLGEERHGLYTMVYWACAVTFASTFARQAPAKIRKSWDAAMKPPAPPPRAPPVVG